MPLEAGRTRFDLSWHETLLERIKPPLLTKAAKSLEIRSDIPPDPPKAALRTATGMLTPPPTIALNTDAPSSPSKPAVPGGGQSWKYPSSLSEWHRPTVSKGLDDNDPTDTLVFTITDDRHLGQLWEIYGGRLSRVNDPEGSGIPAVVKLMTPSMFPDEHGCRMDGSKDYLFDVERKHTSSSAKKRAIREDWIYRCRLQSLYGTVVPHFFGSFRAATGRQRIDEDDHIYAMILEDMGYPESLASTPWRMPLEFRRDVYNAHLKLHEAQVVHRSLEFRHALKGSSSQVALVDFKRARCLPDVFNADSEARLAKKMAAESVSIAKLLRRQDWTVK
ncbi:hypothetical protein I317_06365 [Kwoniella heveanensis CBS 569]|nr:hypothetical protein I317_06365 [Kwoniella heveanensis CBS 569]